MSNEFNHLQHVSVERLKTSPLEAQNIEIQLSSNDQLPTDKEFERHLLIHISNKYEGQIIKLSDSLCFDFYGRNLILKIFKIRTLPSVEINEQMKNLNLNEEFFHTSSSTTWNIKNDHNEDNIMYPMSNVGGLSGVYEKIMNIVQKRKHQSKQFGIFVLI